MKLIVTVVEKILSKTTPKIMSTYPALKRNETMRVDVPKSVINQIGKSHFREKLTQS